jgi:hypothetical protein
MRYYVKASKLFKTGTGDEVPGSGELLGIGLFIMDREGDKSIDHVFFMHDNLFDTEEEAWNIYGDGPRESDDPGELRKSHWVGKWRLEKAQKDLEAQRLNNELYSGKEKELLPDELDRLAELEPDESLDNVPF